ncbi:MAG: translation initiation factor [Ginsengibacter sp.]
MAKKKLYNTDGIVFSTSPDFNFQNEEEVVESLPPAEQTVTIILDKKHRGGKVVSLINGLVMKNDDLEIMAKQLKSFCGSGGSAKDNEIIIQGDHREKLLQWFLKNGYKRARKI